MGIKKMLMLIWNKEKSVKDQLLQAYWTLFLDDKVFKHDGVAKNLISLYKNANLTEKTSLDELLTYVMKWKDLDVKENKDKKVVDKKKLIYGISNSVYI